jgi:hypothetical protein
MSALAICARSESRSESIEQESTGPRWRLFRHNRLALKAYANLRHHFGSEKVSEAVVHRPLCIPTYIMEVDGWSARSSPRFH